MEQTPSPRLHPALMIAAISVTALSLAGVGVLTGLIPGKPAETANAPASVAAPAAQAVAPVPATPAVTVNVAPAPAAKKPTPKVVTRIVERTSPPVEVIRGEPVREYRDYRPARAVCKDCGAIASVQVVQQDSGPGMGAVAGGVIGGVLGNQVGKGSGKDLATIAGIVGGAVAGHQIEKGQKTTRWDIVVRMDDGSTRSVSSHVEPAWRAGERVRVENGALVADPGYRY